MIPRIIHYCWFGRGKLTPVIEKCMASWKKYCPDWEIHRWDEDNSPMDKPWVQDAYKSRKYAFVADYVRFYALYEKGGVYLDTDLLLIQPIDELVSQVKMFIGREDADHVSFGIIGMPKGEDFCRFCLDYYDSTIFDIQNLPIITEVMTPKLEMFGCKYENCTQTLENGLTVFESSYFYPVHYRDTFDVLDLFAPPYGGFVTPDRPSYAIHLWEKSWGDEWEQFAKKRYRQAFSMVWQTIRHKPFQPMKYYKRLFKTILKIVVH